ncbi:MAG: alpha-ribazole phosphatase [Bacillota bacterium]
MTRVILVRHGQTVWNQDGRFQGHTNVELSEDGKKQARQLAHALKKEKVTAVYTSDLSRAKSTAQIIASDFDLEEQVILELKEINFGRWEGLTYREINEKFSELAAVWRSKPATVQIPGGESFKEVMDRASLAVEQLVLRHPKETVVVVSHGATIRTIICAAVGLDLDHIWQLRLDNTAITTIEYFEPGKGILCCLNDTHHLDC